MMSSFIRRLQGGNLEVFKVSQHPKLRMEFSLGLCSIDRVLRINPSRKLSANLRRPQFGMYVLFPIGWMYYFGTNLDDRFQVKGFWPTAEQSHKIPMDKEEIDKELGRMRMVDSVRRERREREAEAQAQIQAQAQAQAQTQSNAEQ